MGPDRFVLLTRRRLTAFAAGLVPLLFINQLEVADARKRRKKRRQRRRRKQRQPETCLELDAICAPGAKPKCCEGLQCDQTLVDEAIGTFCCQPEGTPCDIATFKHCCSGTCDTLVGGGTCAPCRGRSCGATQPCCGGLACIGGSCDGCRSRATYCTSDDQCCFSACSSIGACLSNAGERCVNDADCQACYMSHNCDGACVGGVCTV